MKKPIEMQSVLRSKLDQSRLCSFDQEVVDSPTSPLIHQDARFIYVKRGCGKILLQGTAHTISSGNLLVILPWQISDIIQVDSALQYYLIPFQLDTVERAAKLFHEQDNSTVEIQKILEDTPIISCDPDLQGEIEHIIDLLRRELGVESTLQHPQPKPLEAIYCVSLLVQLLVKYCRCAVSCPAPKGAILTDYTKVLRYMYLHCSEKLTLKMISNVFYCSESTISSYITQITGLSFFDLLNEMRVGKTINFLLYTDFTLKEMAEFLGYVDESHISKVFAARMGTKISEYRNTYQKVQNICQIEESRMAYTIVNYVYRNFDKELSCKSVAKLFGISIAELHRIFLYQVERNYEDFLNLVRINRASELLVLSDKTVLEIAMEVGYSSTKTLTRNFLKLRLMTPSSYRASLKA